MRHLENCRCLALAILIVFGWVVESRASIGALPAQQDWGAIASEMIDNRTPL